jgi:hypothetical protein
VIDMGDGTILVYSALCAALSIAVGILLGWKVQRDRVTDAQRSADEARRLAEQKMSDSVNGRTLAHAIRALDATSNKRPDGTDRSAPRPDSILVEMADRFFPMPNERDV